jgi:Acetyltransferase (GNAT) family
MHQCCCRVLPLQVGDGTAFTGLADTVEGYVHPDAFGRGIGKLIAAGASASIRRCGASSAPGTRLVPGRSAGDTYGGGWVHVLYTRRPWRRQGVGAALLGDAFGRLWERGGRSVGLGVDAGSDTGAFRLHVLPGWRPCSVG